MILCTQAIDAHAAHFNTTCALRLLTDACVRLSADVKIPASVGGKFREKDPQELNVHLRIELVIHVHSLAVGCVREPCPDGMIKKNNIREIAPGTLRSMFVS